MGCSEWCGRVRDVPCVRQGRAGTGRVGTAVEKVGMWTMWMMWAGRLKSGAVLPVTQGVGLEVAAERCAICSGFQEAGDLAAAMHPGCIAVGWVLCLGSSQLMPTCAVCVLAVPQLWLFPASL